MPAPYTNRISIPNVPAFLGACSYLDDPLHPNHKGIRVTPLHPFFCRTPKEAALRTERVRALRNLIRPKSNQSHALFHWHVMRFPAGTNLKSNEIQRVYHTVIMTFFYDHPLFFNQHIHPDGAIEFNFIVSKYGGKGGLLEESPRALPDYKSIHYHLRKLLTAFNEKREGSLIPDPKIDPDSADILRSYTDEELFEAWNRINKTTQNRVLEALHVKRLYLREGSLCYGQSKDAKEVLLDRSKRDFGLCHQLRWNLMNTYEFERIRTRKKEQVKRDANINEQHILRQTKQVQPTYYHEEKRLRDDQRKTEKSDGRKAPDTPGDSQKRRMGTLS